jgi:hypothetical protein
MKVLAMIGINVLLCKKPKKRSKDPKAYTVIANNTQNEPKEETSSYKTRVYNLYTGKWS